MKIIYYQQKRFIFEKGENKERYEIECGLELWQEIAECFGKDVVVISKSSADITVKIISVPSEMCSWVLSHVNECEVISPKRFRDEIQRIVMEAYPCYRLA